MVNTRAEGRETGGLERRQDWNAAMRAAGLDVPFARFCCFVKSQLCLTHDVVLVDLPFLSTPILFPRRNRHIVAFYTSNTIVQDI